jgi:HD superfamily phosphohydrolase YqeK
LTAIVVSEVHSAGGSTISTQKTIVYQVDKVENVRGSHGVAALVVADNGRV